MTLLAHIHLLNPDLTLMTLATHILPNPVGLPLLPRSIEDLLVAGCRDGDVASGAVEGGLVVVENVATVDVTFGRGPIPVGESEVFPILL
jgi:hypothetical protein